MGFNNLNNLILLLIISVTSFGCSTPPQAEFPVTKAATDLKHLVSPISIHRFVSNNSTYSKYIAETIQAKISEAGYVKVVKSGGRAFLKGNLSLGQIYQDSHSSSYTDKKGKTHYTYYVKKRMSATVTYSFSRRDGRILASGKFTAKYEDKKSASSSTEAQSELKTNDEIRTQLVDELAIKVANAISPVRVSVQIELEEGSHSAIGHGITYMQHGRIDQAIYAWKQVTVKNSKSDRAAALYNIGVALEAKGLYRDAFIKYREADVLEPGKKIYIKALNRVEDQAKQDGETRGYSAR